MKNITYLFGAGASAGTPEEPVIPIVKDFNFELRKYLDLIENSTELQLSDSDKFAQYSGDTKKQIQLDFIASAKEILQEVDKHQSFDTYAKKLYITSPGKLNELKRVLIILFSILQSDKHVDKRYDSFLAAIIKDDISKLPPNIKILSWNYDNQFEKAFTQYSRLQDFATQRAFLGLTVKYQVTQGCDRNKFSIIKLNGSCDYTTNPSYKFPTTKQFYAGIQHEFNLDFLDHLMNLYMISKVTDRMILNFSFAWEKFRIGSNEPYIEDLALDTTEDTNILIVIGYSFPYFNREIDRHVIRGMKNLEKVYFQDLYPEDIRETFLAIREDIPNDRLILRRNVKQFLIPSEL